MCRVLLAGIPNTGADLLSLLRHWPWLPLIRWLMTFKLGRGQGPPSSPERLLMLSY